MDSRSRIKYVVFTISVCLLLQLIISFKLWVPLHRDFPIVPAFECIPLWLGINGATNLYTLTLLGLFVLFIKPFGKTGIISLVLFFTAFVLEDISRLQPWVYLFSFMLLSVIVLKGEQKENRILLVFRLILAATYAWSGFQKLNIAFTEEIFPWLMAPFGLSEFFFEHRNLAYMAGAAELLAGVGLLTKRGQKPALIIVIFIHLFLLVAIGPFGNNWNKVIWPWNVAMIVIVFLAIPLKEEFSFKMLWTNVKISPWFRLVVLLTAFLPVLSYFNLWDNHLSGSLYSGNNPEAIFYYPEEGRNRLPASTAKFQYYNDSTNEEFMLIDQWFIDELEAPFYPQERYFKAVGRHLCKCMQDTSGAGIKITMKEKFSSKQSLRVFSCNNLLKDH